MECKISDHSALEALFQLVNKYHVAKKKVTLKHLSPECNELLRKASPLFAEVIEEAIDDPRYHLAVDPEAFAS